MKIAIEILRNIIINTVFGVQKIILLLSYYLHKPFVKCNDSWVVGVDEIAAYIHNMSSFLPNALSVSFSKNKYYEYEYTYQFKLKSSIIRKIVRAFYGPFLLGYLSNRANGFCYIWQTGFLYDNIDGRAFEFSFLRKRNKKIVCMFLGNDIRAPKLMLEHAKTKNIEVISSYDMQIAPYRLSEKYDFSKKQIAKAADQYADLIFSAPDDQKSYLTRAVEPIFYVYPDDKFYANYDKFENISMIKIVHAPSSPILKGTPLVRAAIKKLKLDGYGFEYVELINFTNDQVLDQLRDAHIVLNQFYSFALGFFAIEALASSCALLTSAHHSLEESLPKDSDDAWLSTQFWEVYDNLKFLLDNPHLMKSYALSGYEWTMKHYSFSSVKKNLLNRLLN